jgi:hypothetical protein
MIALNEMRKKFWIRLVVIVMIAALVLPSLFVIFGRG